MLNIESLLGQIPKELADRKKKKREMQKLFQTYGQELVVLLLKNNLGKRYRKW